MFLGEKICTASFASVRQFFVALGLALSVVPSLLAATAWRAVIPPGGETEAATTQFARAEEQRARVE